MRKTTENKTIRNEKPGQKSTWLVRVGRQRKKDRGVTKKVKKR